MISFKRISLIFLALGLALGAGNPSEAQADRNPIAEHIRCYRVLESISASSRDCHFEIGLKIPLKQRGERPITLEDPRPGYNGVMTEPLIVEHVARGKKGFFFRRREHLKSFFFLQTGTEGFWIFTEDREPANYFSFQQNTPAGRRGHQPQGFNSAGTKYAERTFDYTFTGSDPGLSFLYTKRTRSSGEPLVPHIAPWAPLGDTSHENFHRLRPKKEWGIEARRALVSGLNTSAHRSSVLLEQVIRHNPPGKALECSTEKAGPTGILIQEVNQCKTVDGASTDFKASLDRLLKALTVLERRGSPIGTPTAEPSSVGAGAGVGK